MSDFEESAVKLHIEWSPAEDHLTVIYSVENKSSQVLLVFDRLYTTDRSGERAVVPDLAWRWIEADGSYIIAKYVPPIPEYMAVEVPELPYARFLQPGEGLTGQVLLPIPLDDMRPYVESPPMHQVSVVNALEFRLGYAVAESDVQLRRIKAGDETVLSLNFGWAKTRQRLLRVTESCIELPFSAFRQP